MVWIITIYLEELSKFRDKPKWQTEIKINDFNRKLDK
jgi:hypothetical protein